jgi:hypothetical protein
MSTTTQMTEKMAQLWNAANAANVGAEHTRLSRNPDATVRAAYKAEREITGTRAWAIFKCGSLATSNHDDSTCDALIAALEGN